MVLKVVKPNELSMVLDFLPVTSQNLQRYLNTGIQSYKEHYLHLWKNSDPNPFISTFLTKESVLKNLQDPNQLFYIISADDNDAGILNITLDDEKGCFLSKNNLLLNKIYLLRSYANGGIGSKSLEFTYQLAKKYQKDLVWLYAMKKGKPVQFYQKHGFQIIKEAFIELPYVLEKEKEMWLMAKKILLTNPPF